MITKYLCIVLSQYRQLEYYVDGYNLHISCQQEARIQVQNLATIKENSGNLNLRQTTEAFDSFCELTSDKLSPSSSASTLPLKTGGPG